MNILSLVYLPIVAVVVFVAIFRRPAIGAAIILALVNFERVLIFNGISLVKLMSIVCVGILIARMFVARKGIRLDLTTWLIALFLAWIAITSFWSANQSGILSELVSLILQSLMYLLMINLVGSKDDLKLALWGYVIGGTVLAVILSNTMINLNFLRSTEMEIAGLGINLAARMVGLNLLFAILLTQLEEGLLAKFCLIGVAILSGIGSLLALSRGNWYALAVSAVVLVIIMGVKNRLQFTIKQFAVLVVVGYVAFYSARTFLFSEYGLSKLQERFVSALTFSDGASGRFDIWRTVWDPFSEKPLFGHGFNSFKELNEWKHTGAHNAFVLIAVEDGLIGLFFFLLIFGSVFIKLWNALMEKHASPIALGWGMALLVFLGTVSLVDTAVNRKYLWFVLSLITLIVHYFGMSQQIEETVDEHNADLQIGTAKQFV